MERNLPTQWIGKTVLVYDQVESTNDLLKPIMGDPHYNGLAIFARHQRRGRGREDRTWISPPNTSIICSMLIFLPGRLNELAGPVALASAIGTAQAIARTFGLSVKIKWPNDIFYLKKKLSGMLIESSQVDSKTASFVIGVGINVAQQANDFPNGLSRSACSIAQALGRSVEEHETVMLARDLLVQIDTAIGEIIEGNFARLRHDWLMLAGGPDQPIIVNRQDQTFNARIIDIDHRDNSLLVQDHDGLILHLHQNICKIIG